MSDHVTTPPPGSWAYALRIPPSVLGPGVARTTARTILQHYRMAELVDRAELLTSELATNAYRHTQGPAVVRFAWRNDVLRITVWDSSTRLPLMPCADQWDERGRGLFLVTHCADRWGSRPLGGSLRARGKVVWCELDGGAAPGA
ncbi:ATP-binding protein [Streptomyces sp. NPDC003077]|uniref:ATP-binding protein n=1 Tax=Streptomyces sp. NPDC003077 TaxID=3154443 RepID=UPI0033A2EF21